MRELKFRAYIEENGQKSFEFIDLNNTNTDELARFHAVTNKFGVKKNQYTGLKDKNGKEIYEGDIVDYNDDGECMGVVEYDAPNFILNDERFENLGSLFLKGAPHQKVIGNIHENPELLEEEDAER